jgi:hypothetical protein
MYWIIAYFYILDIIYIKDKILVTLLHVDANYANRIFSIHFYQYSIIWFQLTFNFFNFIIRWSILGSTFLSKSLCIYNDIKKVIQYFWIDIFKLIWKLIFPRVMHNYLYKIEIQMFLIGKKMMNKSGFLHWIDYFILYKKNFEREAFRFSMTPYFYML